MYELAATQQFSTLLPNHMYELVATHQFSKLLPSICMSWSRLISLANYCQTICMSWSRPISLANYCQTICMRQCGTHQFSKLLPNHMHPLVRDPLVQQTTAKPHACVSAGPISLANYCQTICMSWSRPISLANYCQTIYMRQCATHQFFKPLSIEKQISNLVRMMCFQNNLHQVLSMSKDWKAK